MDQVAELLHQYSVRCAKSIENGEMVLARHDVQLDRQSARIGSLGIGPRLADELRQLRASNHDAERRQTIGKRAQRTEPCDLGVTQVELLVEIAQGDRLKVEDAADRQSTANSRMARYRRGQMPAGRPAADEYLARIEAEIVSSLDQERQGGVDLGDDVGQ